MGTEDLSSFGIFLSTNISWIFLLPFMPKGLNLSPGNTFLTFNFLGFIFSAQKKAFAGREPIEQSYLLTHPVSLLISNFHLGRFFFSYLFINLKFPYSTATPYLLFKSNTFVPSVLFNN